MGSLLLQAFPKEKQGEEKKSGPRKETRRGIKDQDERGKAAPPRALDGMKRDLLWIQRGRWRHWTCPGQQLFGPFRCWGRRCHLPCQELGAFHPAPRAPPEGRLQALLSLLPFPEEPQDTVDAPGEMRLISKQMTLIFINVINIHGDGWWIQVRWCCKPGMTVISDTGIECNLSYCACSESHHWFFYSHTSSSSIAWKEVHGNKLGLFPW